MLIVRHSEFVCQEVQLGKLQRESNRIQNSELYLFHQTIKYTRQEHISSCSDAASQQRDKIDSGVSFSGKRLSVVDAQRMVV